MTISLISDRDEILNKLTEFDVVDCWTESIGNDFRTKFSFIQQAHQIEPLFAPKKPLTKPPKEQLDQESKGEWVSYYQPSVSVAKRASATPCLDPSNSIDTQSMALLCSVIVPSAKLLTPRQLRWLDLFALKLVVINNESNVIHLFRNEYVFLRRLNVFTSAHPVKFISFPVSSVSPYTQNLMEQYSAQSIICPYFNTSIMENITADYMSCMTINGFKQQSLKDNDWYQALSTTYTGMMKRYERCHQLKGIVLGLMVSNKVFATNPETINPFNIRFKYKDQVIDASLSEKQQARQVNDHKHTKLLLTMGAVGIYEVLLDKSPDQPNLTLDQLRLSNFKTTNHPLSGSLNFFLSCLGSGILPFDTIDTILSQIFSEHLHNETYRQLLYNNENHLAFLNEVNKDDALLPLYLKISNDSAFIQDNADLILNLSHSTKPLDILREHQL